MPMRRLCAWYLLLLQGVFALGVFIHAGFLRMASWMSDLPARAAQHAHDPVALFLALLLCHVCTSRRSILAWTPNTRGLQGHRLPALNTCQILLFSCSSPSVDVHTCVVPYDHACSRLSGPLQKHVIEVDQGVRAPPSADRAACAATYIMYMLHTAYMCDMHDCMVEVCSGDSFLFAPSCARWPQTAPQWRWRRCTTG